MSDRRLPRYVDRGGELVYRQPYLAHHVRQHLFLLSADPARLAALFERSFSVPSARAVEVHPAVPFVALAVSEIREVRSAEPPHRALGRGIAEREIAFMALGREARTGRLLVHVPYLYVDSGMAMAGGREVYGFPKQEGTLAVTGAPALERASVSVLAAERFDPAAPWTETRLLEIRRAGGTRLAGALAAVRRFLALPWRQELALLREGWHALEGLVRGDEPRQLVVQALRAVAAGAVPLVFLKQFRDVAEPERACYQAITETYLRLTRYRAGALLGEYTVTLADLASEPLRADLGLDAGPITPVLGAWLDYDFRLEAGRELWNARDARDDEARRRVAIGSPRRREKVAILGGGAAALATAFELTSAPDWRERYESVTVYQVGWRLGGKGASGRGRNGRIEEHGLHLWLGFYENAFRVMRACYEELGRPAGAPLARWDEAFCPASFVVLEDRHGGEWRHWPIVFPPMPGTPGDGVGEAPTLWQCVERAVPLIERLLHATVHEGAREVREHWQAVGGAVRKLAHEHHGRHGLVGLLDRALAAMHAEEARVDASDDLRRALELAQLVAASVRGILADGVLADPRGLDALDGWDYREWLGRHGASPRALDNAVLRGAYDLTFAYRDGDPAQPALAAGQALRSAMRMFFGYKGALYWKMQAGMGDVVFAPLYEVLRRRGVAFEFFHRVDALHLTDDRAAIAGVDLGRQVELEGDRYDPLVDVRGLPCWPAEPRWEQIRDAGRVRGRDLESFWDPAADAGAVTLHAGRDFDRLVFGISLGAVPYLCRELIAHHPDWRAMVDNVATVQTQAFQLWLTPDMAQLGWQWTAGRAGWQDARQVDVSSYVEPFDTWADMAQLIPREDWPSTDPVGAIAYFCGAMPTERGVRPAPDPAFAAAERDRVKAAALAFLREHVGRLWPAAVAGGDFRWELLAGAGTAKDTARLDSQFWRANVDPSERYVLSLPGTNTFRMKTDATGYANLYVVGDWIDCGFNLGCVEAAVTAGLQGARAVDRDVRAAR